MKKFLKWSLSENQWYSLISGETVTNGMVLQTNLACVLLFGIAFALCSLVEHVC